MVDAIKPVDVDLVSIPNRDFDKFQRIGPNMQPIFATVSIPNRDFDKFQLYPTSQNSKKLVSIPNRDFDKFQLGLGIGYLGRNLCLFQSLIGILISFNVTAMVAAAIALTFQSLIGILISFNVAGVECDRKFLPVSIPNRDFDKFQLAVGFDRSVVVVCFNP